MREIKKHKFSKIFDLQNSSRTNFYKNILFPKAGKDVWSSSLSTLPSDKNKEEFDKDSVLKRFDYQLKKREHVQNKRKIIYYHIKKMNTNVIIDNQNINPEKCILKFN